MASNQLDSRKDLLSMWRQSIIYFETPLIFQSKYDILKESKEMYINNCPTRCNTKKSIYYSAISPYIFRLSTTPIIRSTQNCNYSLRYWSYFLCSYLPPAWPSLRGSCTKNMTSTGGCSYSFVYSWWRCCWHPKHVERTCRIINRLLYAASHWTIINIDQRCTEPKT